MKKIAIYKGLAIGLLFGFYGCSENQKEAVSNNTDPIPVTVAKIASFENNMPLIVSGTIKAVNTANLSTRLMGYVERIKVKVGDKVTKGQILLSINNNDLQAKKAQINAGILEAKAVFEIAEKDFERYTNLYKENSASQKELDDVKANYNMAKARLESARQMKNEINSQFAYTNIHAPFNGVVTAKFINKGDLANPGMPLLAIESPNSFEVVARVPETSISKISKGEEVDVIVSSIDISLKGIITEVSTSSSHSGGQYLVKIAIETPNEKIRSGMFATVQLPNTSTEFSKLERTIMIPKDAIITNGQLSGVYTVSQQNTAVLRWLRIGKSIGDQVEVLSGLTTNETYIRSSEEKLYNGAKISVQ